jgi:hypothetical protein
MRFYGYRTGRMCLTRDNYVNTAVGTEFERLPAIRWQVRPPALAMSHGTPEAHRLTEVNLMSAGALLRLPEERPR